MEPRVQTETGLHRRLFAQDALGRPQVPQGPRHVLAGRVAETEALTQQGVCVAGEESYILKVRVPTPAELETLLAEIRAAANVRTRTIVVLSTPYEGRPPAL